MAVKAPTEKVISVTAVSDRIVCLTSDGRMWVAVRTGGVDPLNWVEINQPPLNVLNPQDKKDADSSS
jgi:hypothetical protein